MLQREHSAILLTFIKLPFVIKIFVLSFLSGRLHRFYCTLLKQLDPDQKVNKEPHRYYPHNESIVMFIIPPQTLFEVGILFSRCPSATFCFLNNSRVTAGFSSNLTNMFIYARQIL